MLDYKKSGREPIAWITRGGKHIPIFDDKIEEDKLYKMGTNAGPKNTDIEEGDTVYHVAPPTYKSGDPIYSGERYEEITGDILEDKWSENISPDFNYKEYADFKRVSVFDTFEEAFAYNRDIYNDNGKILEIEVQEPLNRGNEGYGYAEDKIPASWITRELSVKTYLRER